MHAYSWSVFLLFFLIPNLKAQESFEADTTFSEIETYKWQTEEGKWMVGGNFGVGLGFLNESLTFNESIVFLLFYKTVMLKSFYSLF